MATDGRRVTVTDTPTRLDSADGATNAQRVQRLVVIIPATAADPIEIGKADVTYGEAPRYAAGSVFRDTLQPGEGWWAIADTAVEVEVYIHEGGL